MQHRCERLRGLEHGRSCSCRSWDPDMANRLTLRDLFTVGPRAAWRYTGTLLSVFVVQAIITLVCILAIARILSNEFAALPLWDDAVDGDPVAIAWCLKHGASSFVAVAGVIMG